MSILFKRLMFGSSYYYWFLRTFFWKSLKNACKTWAQNLNSSCFVLVIFSVFKRSMDNRFADFEILAGYCVAEFFEGNVGTDFGVFESCLWWSFLLYNPVSLATSINLMNKTFFSFTCFILVHGDSLSDVKRRTTTWCIVKSFTCKISVLNTYYKSFSIFFNLSIFNLFQVSNTQQVLLL